MEGTMQLPPPLTVSTLRFEWTGITGSGVCAVLHLLGLLLGSKWTEELTLRADIHILRRVVGELGGPKVGRHMLPIGQRNVGADARVFQGSDVLEGAILRVARHRARPQFPAKARAKDEVAHGLVVHHFRRSDQHLENDAHNRQSPVDEHGD